MIAVQTASVPAAAVPAASRPFRLPMLRVLRALLITQAVITLALTVFLSLLAAGMRDFVGGNAGRAAEETIRFVAAAAFVFAIFAAIASRGARRRRTWSWTLAALLQVVAAIGTGVAIMTATWHPALLVGFVISAAVMLVLSTPSVRGALGQE